MLFLRNVAGFCWLLPHSAGSVKSEQSQALPIQTRRGRPWGLTFRVLETWTKLEVQARNVVFEGGWRAVLAVATLDRVCLVRAISCTAHPDPL
jgi:hypothetical protein